MKNTSAAIAVAELEEIRANFDYQHEIDESKVAVIIAAMDAGREMPAVLVLEDEGNGHAVLDGHHRAEAAHRLGLRTVKAWVVSIADYASIVDEHFDGFAPERMSDLDDYISCDGTIYSQMGLR